MRSKSRRAAREGALRSLYQIELAKITADSAVEDTLAHEDLQEDLRSYLSELVRGVVGKKTELDRLIGPLLKGWSLDRMAAVDRSILRIAAFELFFVPDVPPAVTINEAVEVAKKYSTAESGKFVNGVLGTLLSLSPKAQWDPGQAPAEEPGKPEQEPPLEAIGEDSPEAEELKKVGLWRTKSAGGGL